MVLVAWLFYPKNVIGASCRLPSTEVFSNWKPFIGNETNRVEFVTLETDLFFHVFHVFHVIKNVFISFI